MFANMPTQAWYLLIVGAVIVLVLAIWLGRGIKIRKGGITVDPVRNPAPTGVSVAKNARIEGSKVGDITGVSVTGQSGLGSTKSPVDVLGGAAVKDAEIGNVTGVRHEEKKPQSR